MFYSLSSKLLFIGDTIASDCFKEEITPSLKANDRLKLPQYVALDRVRKRGKPRCKLSCKVLKEKYGYDTLINIYPYIKLIQLEYSIGGIHHCVIVVGKWIFDSNFTFALPLTKENLYYCWINDNKTKGINGYKVLLESIRFFTKDNNKIVI